MTWALLLVLEMIPSPLELGLLAESQGRHADAVLLLEPPMRDAPTYDGLMALGLAEARLGRSGDARATFDRAVALDGRRPEALVERAGLDFLDKRYDAAAEGLALALARHDDAYARELRASALQLAGRTEEALDEWNRLDQPRVADVRLAGLVKTRDRVARRELPFVEGELLRAESFREARLRLQEVGVFPFVRVRAVPRDDRRADVEVAVLERSGFGTWKELVASGAYNAFLKQVRLRYFDLGGEGVVLRAEYRWESTQPHVIGSISWPRPLGLPARLVVLGVRARPEYALGDGPLTLRTNGVDVGLRRVVGSRTVVEAGWRLRERTYSHPRPDAPDGTLSTVGLGVERSLVADLRNRLHATLRLGTSAGRRSDPTCGSRRARSPFATSGSWRCPTKAPSRRRPSPRASSWEPAATGCRWTRCSRPARRPSPSTRCAGTTRRRTESWAPRRSAGRWRCSTSSGAGASSPARSGSWASPFSVT
jgi:hypothetical protein